MTLHYPTRLQAEQLLIEAESCNPGPWGSHSHICAQCAEQIARHTNNLDPDKAYVLGLLHDIGRKFGAKHLGHVYDGYHYMMSLGFDDVARICLTHSFCVKSLDSYVGKQDIEEQQLNELMTILGRIQYDDYDLLIQLCDCLAGSDGIMDIEARMLDVKARYGFYPQDKWDKNIELRCYFEQLCNYGIYNIIR